MPVLICTDNDLRDRVGLGEGFILDMRVGLGMYFCRCGAATVVVYCFLPEVCSVVVKKKLRILQKEREFSDFFLTSFIKTCRGGVFVGIFVCGGGNIAVVFNV